MATIEQLQAQLAARRARQPAWKTKQDDYLYDRGYSPSDGSRPVLFIRILVNEVSGQSGQSGQSVPMAHFRILLVLDTSATHAASVELNSTGVVATTGGTRLHVVSRNWTRSAGSAPRLAERDVYFVPGRAPTVDNVLDLLIHNNRHHYRLHSSGSGCRYWTKVVLQDLISAGYMVPGSEGAVAATMADISRVRPTF